MQVQERRVGLLAGLWHALAKNLLPEFQDVARLACRVFLDG